MKSKDKKKSKVLSPFFSKVGRQPLFVAASNKNLLVAE